MGRSKKLVADITGGTKAMTASLAMAGAFLGIQLLYVHNREYDREIRRPKPGTEYLEFIHINWSKFANEVQKRNFSILAHGYIFVNADQFNKFKDMVEGIFNLFCRVEGINMELSAEKHQIIEDPFAEMVTCLK